MKLTKKLLDKYVGEVIKEISGTQGGTAAISRIKTAGSDKKSKEATKNVRKTRWDNAISTYNTKVSDYNTKVSAFDSRKSDYDSHVAEEPTRYRSQDRVGRSRYSDDNTAARPVGFNAWHDNPSWTTWDSEKTSKQNAKDSAESEKNTAETEKNTAETDKNTKAGLYNDAVADLTAAEKEELAAKKDTNFGFGAGGGGRATGAAGTVAGTEAGEEGGEDEDKNESLFRILGRDLIKELKDIKKYSK